MQETRELKQRGEAESQRVDARPKRGSGIRRSFNRLSSERLHCEPCGRSFASQRAYIAHAAQHAKSGQLFLQCPHCAFRSPHSHIVSMHIKRMHGSTEMTCRLCGIRIPYHSNISLHMWTSHGIVHQKVGKMLRVTILFYAIQWYINYNYFGSGEMFGLISSKIVYVYFSVSWNNYCWFWFCACVSQGLGLCFVVVWLFIYKISYHVLCAMISMELYCVGYEGCGSSDKSCWFWTQYKYTGWRQVEHMLKILIVNACILYFCVIEL